MLATHMMHETNYYTWSNKCPDSVRKQGAFHIVPESGFDDMLVILRGLDLNKTTDDGKGDGPDWT